MTKSRAERAAALESWAEPVDPEDLRDADTDSLRHIAEHRSRVSTATELVLDLQADAIERLGR